MFDNEQNKSTGGQNTYQNILTIITLPALSGFSINEEIITDLKDFIPAINNAKGLCFIHVKCGLDIETPRPPLDVVKINKLR